MCSNTVRIPRRTVGFVDGVPGYVRSMSTTFAVLLAGLLGATVLIGLAAVRGRPARLDEIATTPVAAERQPNGADDGN